MSRNALALGIAAAPFVTVATLFFGAPTAMADNYQASSDPQFTRGNATAPTPRGSAGGEVAPERVTVTLRRPNSFRRTAGCMVFGLS